MRSCCFIAVVRALGSSRQKSPDLLFLRAAQQSSEFLAGTFKLAHTAAIKWQDRKQQAATKGLVLVFDQSIVCLYFDNPNPTYCVAPGNKDTVRCGYVNMHVDCVNSTNSTCLRTMPELFSRLLSSSLTMEPTWKPRTPPSKTQ